MIHILRFLFWPIVWLVITGGAALINLNIWGELWEWLKADPIDRAVTSEYNPRMRRRATLSCDVLAKRDRLTSLAS